METENVSEHCRVSLPGIPKFESQNPVGHHRKSNTANLTPNALHSSCLHVCVSYVDLADDERVTFSRAPPPVSFWQSSRGPRRPAGSRQIARRPGAAITGRCQNSSPRCPLTAAPPRPSQTSLPPRRYPDRFSISFSRSSGTTTLVFRHKRFAVSSTLAKDPVKIVATTTGRTTGFEFYKSRKPHGRVQGKNISRFNGSTTGVQRKYPIGFSSLQNVRNSSARQTKIPRFCPNVRLGVERNSFGFSSHQPPVRSRCSPSGLSRKLTVFIRKTNGSSRRKIHFYRYNP